MSVACARYFAADWEAASFLEFFVDLQGRVAAEQGSAGRTLARLRDHARFALQMTLVRSVDSFFSYVAEAEQLATTSRAATPLGLVAQLLGSPLGSDALIRNERALSHGNVRQLDRHFAEATSVHLFQTPDEIERASQLVVLRNFVAHGRTFASDDLAALVNDATSVGGIGLKLSAVRAELECLRSWVARTDSALADSSKLPQPITSLQLFEAIARAAGHRGVGDTPYELETT